MPSPPSHLTRRPRRTITIAIATAGVLLLAATASTNAQEVSYAVADIGSVLAPTGSSFVTALNEDGDACGEAWIGSTRAAFVYTYERGPVALPALAPYTNARAYDLTERRADGAVTVVGVVTDSFYQEDGDRGAWWTYSTRTGELIASGLVEPLPGFARSTLVAINKDRVAVGRSVDPGIQQMTHRLDDGLSQAIDFPSTIVDLNNAGQIVGGNLRGDLRGAFEPLGWPRAASGVGLTAINDAGDCSAVANMPFTDGAGWFVNGLARHVDGVWHLIAANSRFDGAVDINIHGDVVGVLGVSGAARPVVYAAETGTLSLVNELIDPFEQFLAQSVSSINDHGQLGIGGVAAVLTPLGRMIIPGDVNGDAEVEAIDLCAWRSSPIDLDDDGDADDADEAWLVERLADLGITISDCDGKGVPDVCDIADGDAEDCDLNGVPDRCQTDCDADGVPDACEPDCNANGIPDDCDLADASSDDCNDNGIPDECDDADTIVVASIPDPPAPLFEGVPYSESILVGASGAIADVRVSVDLDYRIGQVTLRLRHAGVDVTLVDRPGSSSGNTSGYSNLGYRIALHDDATQSIQAIGASCCDFGPITSPPAYRPLEALSAFDGLPRDGVWELEFIGGFAQHFDPKLLGWSLEITDEAVEVGDCECPADLNGSGAVEVGDIGLLLAAWGTSGADLTGDGTTDAGDLGMLIGAWGPCD